MSHELVDEQSFGETHSHTFEREVVESASSKRKQLLNGELKARLLRDLERYRDIIPELCFNLISFLLNARVYTFDLLEYRRLFTILTSEANCFETNRGIMAMRKLINLLFDLTQSCRKQQQSSRYSIVESNETPVRLLKVQSLSFTGEPYDVPESRHLLLPRENDKLKNFKLDEDTTKNPNNFHEVRIATSNVDDRSESQNHDEKSIEFAVDGCNENDETIESVVDGCNENNETIEQFLENIRCHRFVGSGRRYFSNWTRRFCDVRYGETSLYIIPEHSINCPAKTIVVSSF
ncbi:hypothetical protein KPH14_013124 [Odynerus spinipes]|uniref:Uncharacterized protein n=1 Tax=Odynerus spinipes TaxID=1348599 RepID=A0AAD9VHM1_9HYME|nr:hypothetical protein KPH14_013124 [Odynerus spinipes]